MRIGRGVADRVGDDHPAGGGHAAAQQRDREAGDGRADDARDVEAGRVEPHGVGEVGLVDHLGDEGLARGGVERGGDPEHEGQDVDVPDLHRAGDRQDAQHHRGGGHADVRHLEQAALGDPVGDDAGERRQQQDREELQPGRDADRGRAVGGQQQHQPVLGDALHPGADVRHQVARCVAAVVGVVQGAERGAHDHPTTFCARGEGVMSRPVSPGSEPLRAARLVRQGSGRPSAGPARRRAGGGRPAPSSRPRSVSVTSTWRRSVSCGRRTT